MLGKLANQIALFHSHDLVKYVCSSAWMEKLLLRMRCHFKIVTSSLDFKHSVQSLGISEHMRQHTTLSTISHLYCLPRPTGTSLQSTQIVVRDTIIATYRITFGSPRTGWTRTRNCAVSRDTTLGTVFASCGSTRIWN